MLTLIVAGCGQTRTVTQTTAAPAVAPQTIPPPATPPVTTPPPATTTTSQPTASTTPANAYPPDLQARLMGACRGAWALTTLPDSYCGCALKTLEANLPVSQVGDPVTAGQAMVQDPDIKRACAH